MLGLQGIRVLEYGTRSTLFVTAGTWCFLIVGGVRCRGVREDLLERDSITAYHNVGHAPGYLWLAS